MTVEPELVGCRVFDFRADAAIDLSDSAGWERRRIAPQWAVGNPLPDPGAPGLTTPCLSRF
jgi:hypothetical protein